MSTSQFLDLDKIHFSYLNAPKTIDNVSLKVKKGECVVIMGPSGSGKTTITRLINGLAGGYYDGTMAGQLWIDGREAIHLPPWQRAKQVGSVFQDPASQFFSSQLAGEIAFGCENLGYAHEEVVDRTDEAIDILNLNDLRELNIDLLSSGQKQKTAIASALAPRPTIIVMDEPSSNLDMPGTRALGKTIADLKSRGFTIVIAEHRISYLMESVDRFYYISDGSIVCTYSAEEVLAIAPSKRHEMGIRAPGHVPRPQLEPPCSEPSGQKREKHCLEISDLSLTIGKKSIFSSVNLTVTGGQILALTGENGAGKTCLAKVIAGLMKKSSGDIIINGKLQRGRRKLVWYSSNDVSAQFFTASVEEEVLLSSGRKEEDLKRAREILKKLGLYELKENHPLSLSGGQKQRLSIACGLLYRRAVLILDEPTSGLDAINMLKLADALKDAAAEGTAVIVITHDNEFMEACCTHNYDLSKERGYDSD